MALNFPNSPATGQSYSQGDRTWIYNGYGWALQGIRSGSFFSRTYTGNGTANAFVVTTGVTANSIIVTENGVVQQPIADYSVTGTVLTFTAAPAANVKITIHELGYPAEGTGGTAEAQIHPFMLSGM